MKHHFCFFHCILVINVGFTYEQASSASFQYLQHVPTFLLNVTIGNNTSHIHITAHNSNYTRPLTPAEPTFLLVENNNTSHITEAAWIAQSVQRRATGWIVSVRFLYSTASRQAMGPTLSPT